MNTESESHQDPTSLLVGAPCEVRLTAALSDSLPVRLTSVDLKVGQDEAGINGLLAGCSTSRTVTQVSVCD